MNYEQTLEYLFTKLPLFSQVGKLAYKEDLTNTILLCNAIENPQNKFKSIHVAGTNGKGSVSHMLAAIFQNCGYKTGLYTSPHLKDFRERIKVNGEMIAKDFVVDFTAKIKEVSEKIEPSFFELTVAMAFDYFKYMEIDIAIIETGLGGRLDSTNIIMPELSVITNIGYDHMNILGNTLEQIAYEKAGIIKKNIPVIIGEVLPETKPIFLSKATACNSPVVFAEEKFEITNTTLNFESLDVQLTNNVSKETKNYKLDLNGIYQQKNLRTVITALEELKIPGCQPVEEKVHTALSNVKKITGLHGRWDVIHREPMIVLDVAHNEDGIKQLRDQLALCSYKNLHIVFGIVKDKDADKVLSLLPKKATYYFTRAQIPRAMDETALLVKAKEYNLNGSSFAEVNHALKAAMDKALPGDLILVCGSVFVVGEVDMKVFANSLTYQ